MFAATQRYTALRRQAVQKEHGGNDACPRRCVRTQEETRLGISPQRNFSCFCLVSRLPTSPRLAPRIVQCPLLHFRAGAKRPRSTGRHSQARSRTRRPRGSQFRESVVSLRVHGGWRRKRRHDVRLDRVAQRVAVEEVRVLVGRQREGIGHL